MEKKLTILIVEDHALTSFALQASLSGLENVENVMCAKDAANAFELIKENNPDIILMDLGLPKTNGVDAIKEIRKTDKDVKIVVLTSHSEKEEVEECLNLGISAYCTKDINPEKLQDVVKDVAKGSMYFDSNISKYVMMKTVNASAESIFANSNISVKDCYNLTQQEKKVLILLASGYSNFRIAKKLNLSINTVKVHMCSVLQKMNVEDRTQAAIKAIRENLIN